jgi:hypothetical protein
MPTGSSTPISLAERSSASRSYLLARKQRGLRGLHLDTSYVLGRQDRHLRGRIRSARKLTARTAFGVPFNVPFARVGSRFTTDFEDLVAYLATKTDKTTITRVQRIDWDTVAGSVNAWSPINAWIAASESAREDSVLTAGDRAWRGYGRDRHLPVRSGSRRGTTGGWARRLATTTEDCAVSRVTGGHPEGSRAQP